MIWLHVTSPRGRIGPDVLLPSSIVKTYHCHRKSHIFCWSVSLYGENLLVLSWINGRESRLRICTEQLTARRRRYTPKLNFVGIKCQLHGSATGFDLCWEIYIKVYIKKIIGACEHVFRTFICWEQFERDKRRSRSQSNIAGCV
jgi:hypothetical protein